MLTDTATESKGDCVALARRERGPRSSHLLKHADSLDKIRSGPMVGQDGGMLLHTVSVEFLDSPSNDTVELLPPLRQETLVGHILDDRVFEDIFQLGEKTLFVY